MKKALSILAAVALALPGAAYAQGNANGHSNAEVARDNHGQQVSRAAHSFQRGEKFSRTQASNYRRVSYSENSRLSRPPSGQVWVRSGSDALLVRLSDNIVQQVVASVF